MASGTRALAAALVKAKRVDDHLVVEVLNLETWKSPRKKEIEKRADNAFARFVVWMAVTAIQNAMNEKDVVLFLEELSVEERSSKIKTAVKAVVVSRKKKLTGLVRIRKALKGVQAALKALKAKVFGDVINPFYKKRLEAKRNVLLAILA